MTCLPFSPSPDFTLGMVEVSVSPGYLAFVFVVRDLGRAVWSHIALLPSWALRDQRSDCFVSGCNVILNCTFIVFFRSHTDILRKQKLMNKLVSRDLYSFCHIKTKDPESTV